MIRLAEQLLEVPLEAEGRFPRVRVLSRDDLEVMIVPVSPSERCSCGRRVPDVGLSQRLAHDLGRPDGPQYRAVSLDEVARDIDGLANPFCSGVGADAVRDLEIETTAKVSGAYVSRSADSVWTCPWGGHTSRYTRSHAIGRRPAPTGLPAFGLRPQGRSRPRPDVLGRRNTALRWSRRGCAP